MSSPSPDAEWLETDGLGGFASSTASGIRTRRYHALLLVATAPPTGRFVLANGFEAWVETPAGTFALSSQRYAPDVVHPDGARFIESFSPDPWPRWTYRLPDGTRIDHGLLIPHGTAATALFWRLRDGAAATLHVRPLLSGRDYHALHHENPAFRFDAEVAGDRVVWKPYPDVPAVVSRTNGSYTHDPVWYRRFLYTAERARGLDHVEDLASPGILRWDLAQGEAQWVLAAEGHERSAGVATLRAQEQRRRRRFASRLQRAADAYVVRRGRGKTVVAGYPWFAEWGRDTFIALRGLCLATRACDDARTILLDWAGAVSQGMLPNRFPDRGGEPEFNAVDASLWYVVAVHDLLTATAETTRGDRRTLEAAVEAILQGYAAGTRYGIHADIDGLLAAGEPGVQLTWMDAKVGDWVVTPRIGKPVEVQALWLNALRIGSAWSERWADLLAKAQQAFAARFWDEARGHLADVVDVDHRAGTADLTFRPNQIFAVGGLPFAALDGPRARRVVDAVEARLLTPMGLRSLAPDEPGYAPHYAGGIRERDAAYHQGTAWPWLLGAFVEAWVRVRGGTVEAKTEARARFLEPLLARSRVGGLGHLPEVADGDPPHAPGGCPFQAWSVGEALRLDLAVLAGALGTSGRRPARERA
jgi:predicted glycogen debranching enzyme